VGPQTDKHEFPTLDQSTSLGICGDLPDLLSLPVVSGRCDRQLRWRLVLAGETLSHAGAVQRSEMENAERPDAGLANYNNVLTLGVSSEGLYLATMLFFRFMHPPLLIPWSEIRVRRSKGWVFEYTTFTIGHELAIPLRIRASLAAKLGESAESYWPVEEV
jgi:hypothetical protein